MNNQELDLFIDLHRKYFQRLVLWCQSYINFDSELRHYAEDWVQEAFLRAINHKGKFIPHPNKYGWLVVTCEHIVKNAIDRRNTRREHDSFSIDADNLSPVSAGKTQVDKWIESEASKDKINSIISRLTSYEAAVFSEIFINREKEATVATKYEKSLSAIKATIRRIRKKADSG